MYFFYISFVVICLLLHISHVSWLFIYIITSLVFFCVFPMYPYISRCLLGLFLILLEVKFLSAPPVLRYSCKHVMNYSWLFHWFPLLRTFDDISLIYCFANFKKKNFSLYLTPPKIMNFWFRRLFPRHDGSRWQTFMISVLSLAIFSS